jgi:outer membrane protein assembly factor BamB
VRRASLLTAGAVLVAGGSLGAWLLSRPQEPAPSGRSTSTVAVRRAAVHDWPTYGRTPARLHAAAYRLRPPYRRVWAVFGDTSFIEFPPVVAAGRLYFGTDRGRTVAVRAGDGAVLWQRFLGHCIAASPAVHGKTVVFTTMGLGPPPCNRGAGQVIALHADDGHILWRFVTTPVESSPLVVAGLVVVGARDGFVNALDLRTGRVAWRFRTGAAVKGSAAAARDAVYIGSYDGHVYALAVRTGRLRWRAGAGKGAFYATPAVAGRSVFVAATDGTVYALDTTTGRPRWTRRLPSFVYSSAAVAGGRIYVGSYDHRLYALAASSGATLWSYPGRGPVSGTPSVLGGLVYFSTCGSCSRFESDPAARRTYAVDARSGRLVWSFPDGEYSPAVSDGRRLYLTGYTTVYALAPLEVGREDG